MAHVSRDPKLQKHFFNNPLGYARMPISIKYIGLGQILFYMEFYLIIMMDSKQNYQNRAEIQEGVKVQHPQESQIIGLLGRPEIFLYLLCRFNIKTIHMINIIYMPTSYKTAIFYASLYQLIPWVKSF